MIKKNEWGKKVIGAALSMVMGFTAVPAMASLACENRGPVNRHQHVSNQQNLEDRLADLCERYIDVANFYYANEDKISAEDINICETILFETSRLIRNPDITNRQIDNAYEALVIIENIVNESLETSGDEFVAPDYGMDLDENTDTYERAQALDNLYNLVVEMNDFVNVFGDEIPEDYNVGLTAWLDFSAAVYADPGAYTEEDINGLINALNEMYDTVICAVDEAEQAPVEDVAPDYGMDLDEDTDDGFVIEHQDDFSITPDFQIEHQDDFTIEGEDTTTDETPVEDVAPDYGMDLDEDTTTDEAPVEDVAPDYGMDLDEDTTTDETPVEDVAPDYGIDMDAQTESSEEAPVIDETPAEEEATPADTATDNEAQHMVVVIVVDNGSNSEAAQTTPAPSAEAPVVTEAPAAPATPAPVPAASESSAPAAPAAPATQVLGATRDRAVLANEIVERLYVNALNRPSDANGKTYWVNMILADNDNLDMVIEGFLGSAEFNARNLSDSEFVNILYRVMFNRRPSASERRQWTNALANGSSRNDVIDAFLDSNEFETMTSVYGF